jgi:TP901-1 family phage major tail protein
MRGVDILLMVNTAASGAPVWTAVGGQRGATFTEESETVDTTSKDSDGAYEYDYGLYGWKISCDGVYVPSEAAYTALKTAMRNKTKIKVRITEDGTATEEGEALVTSRELDAPYDDTVTYSVELQGTGVLTTPAP